MDNETLSSVKKLEQKIDAIYVSVEKTRKYFQWTMIITVVVLVLPLVGLIFIIPTFLSSYESAMGDMSTLGL